MKTITVAIKNGFEIDENSIRNKNSIHYEFEWDMDEYYVVNEKYNLVLPLERFERFIGRIGRFDGVYQWANFNGYGLKFINDEKGFLTIF